MGFADDGTDPIDSRLMAVQFIVTSLLHPRSWFWHSAAAGNEQDCSVVGRKAGRHHRRADHAGSVLAIRPRRMGAGVARITSPVLTIGACVICQALDRLHFIDRGRRRARRRP